MDKGPRPRNKTSVLLKSKGIKLKHSYEPIRYSRDLLQYDQIFPYMEKDETLNSMTPYVGFCIKTRFLSLIVTKASDVLKKISRC